MTSKHFFIHPLLNREERWGGFVISANAFACCDMPCKTAVQLCENAKNTLIDQALPWFVPIAAHACSTEEDTWPVNETVFLTREPENLSEKDDWLVSAEAIRFAGGKAGVIAHPIRTPSSLQGEWDYIVLEISQAQTLPPAKLTVLASQSKIIYTGIKSRKDFEWALANEATLTDAEFLIHRDKNTTQKPDVLSVHVLQLLSLLTQDADTRELENVFRQEPKLSYSLLRLVNSAALSLHTPITSFSQAITLLGRRQLQRWLQLLVYAKHEEKNRTNPLLQWAAMRGKLMEQAFQLINPAPQLAITTDSAFMAGIFSLLDVLLNRPMEEILAQLPITTAVKLALTERAGPLGELLSAIEAGESRKYSLSSQILGELNIAPAAYAQAQLEAIDWGHKVLLPASPI